MSKSTRLSEPDVPDPLDPAVLQVLEAIQQFFDARDQAMQALIGRGMRRSPVREEIIRRTVVAYAEGRPLSVGEAVTICCQHGSGPTVRTEIRRLASLGVISVQVVASDRREKRLVPTSRTNRFYNDVIPKLRAEVGEWLRSFEL